MRFKFFLIMSLCTIALLIWTYFQQDNYQRQKSLETQLTELSIYIYTSDSLHTAEVETALSRFAEIDILSIESGAAIAESLAVEQGFALLPSLREPFSLPSVVTFVINKKGLREGFVQVLMDTLKDSIRKDDMDFPLTTWKRLLGELEASRRVGLIITISMAFLLLLVSLFLRLAFELNLILSRCHREQSIADKLRERNRFRFYSLLYYVIPVVVNALVYYLALGQKLITPELPWFLLSAPIFTLAVSNAILIPIVNHCKGKYYIYPSSVRVVSVDPEWEAEDEANT
ncbi:MAG: hypothetical protein PHI68_04450 [Candidatus Cloacimonetes bacterium]|nr:hypothetical protein [Candidatus Cloacimonadota bacterium]